jgi:Fe-S-cluster containining protein
MLVFMDKNYSTDSKEMNTPDCLECGACCHSINPTLVELLGVDRVAIPDRYGESDAEGGSHMRMSACESGGFVCSALGEKNACRIYERRPFLCREFERGSPECHAAIADQKKPLKFRLH